ncbi:MerR family transcriptional regulator [Neobacillus ginsengisoli]|uniref:DNA-binding transcriptional MerR regulator n=1 Tax=Neobacillus ginsengisoli TaxID=904295 RepID=A0ABT9XNH0_9BACI|nr:MerR family transcriptional regulator [Neobacillus ginsengisoli]MDQ0197079.1 DNA-binding transcriptional MerR regulator [Neobacillus ginsengisoli]
MDINQERLYTPKEVAEHLDITPDLLRKWVEEFNIHTEKTEKGHRRYTKVNIELLMQIRQKLQVESWSWKQVGRCLKGEKEEFMQSVNTNKIEEQLNIILAKLEQHELFNRTLLQRLEQSERIHHEFLNYVRKNRLMSFLNWIKRKYKL